MRKLYERMLFQFFGVIGYSKLFKCANKRFAPGPWHPRYDQHGRIYMLLSAPPSHSGDEGK